MRVRLTLTMYHPEGESLGMRLKNANISGYDPDHTCESSTHVRRYMHVACRTYLGPIALR